MLVAESVRTRSLRDFVTESRACANESLICAEVRPAPAVSLVDGFADGFADVFVDVFEASAVELSFAGSETPAAESTHLRISVTRAARATVARRTESCLTVVSRFAEALGGTTAAVNCAPAVAVKAARAQTSRGMCFKLTTYLRCSGLGIPLERQDWCRPPRDSAQIQASGKASALRLSTSSRSFDVLSYIARILMVSPA